MRSAMTKPRPLPCLTVVKIVTTFYVDIQVEQFFILLKKSAEGWRKKQQQKQTNKQAKKKNKTKLDLDR